VKVITTNILVNRMAVGEYKGCAGRGGITVHGDVEGLD
jgi:hypothetical protein